MHRANSTQKERERASWPKYSQVSAGFGLFLWLLMIFSVCFFRILDFFFAHFRNTGNLRFVLIWRLSMSHPPSRSIVFPNEAKLLHFLIFGKCAKGFVFMSAPCGPAVPVSGPVPRICGFMLLHDMISAFVPIWEKRRWSVVLL